MKQRDWKYRGHEAGNASHSTDTSAAPRASTAYLRERASLCRVFALCSHGSHHCQEKNTSAPIKVFLKEATISSLSQTDEL